MPTATRVSDLLRSIGVDTHIPYTDGGYANVATILTELDYLGVKHVRDGISDGEWGSAPLSSYIAIARAGITFTQVIDSGLVRTSADLAAQLARIRKLIEAVPRSVTSIEGPNEVNNWPVSYNGLTGLEGALALQRDLYAAVHADPAFAGVQVDYFTGYAAGGVDTGPNPFTTPGLADADTQHPYPSYGQAPAAWVDPNRTLPNEPAGARGRFVYTETGYSSNGGTGGAVSADVQARYTLDLLLDAFKAGATETDLYELMDAYPAGSRQGNAGWGLFASGGAAKPVATAIRALTTILRDSGGTAASFGPAALSPTVTGLPATGNSLVLQKSDGTFELAVWAEPAIWDSRTGTQVAAPQASVAIDLTAVFDTVSIYDPLQGPTAVQTLRGTGKVQVGLTDHPLIIEARGQAVPPPPPADTLTLTLSEDAYQGDAQFSVSVDGRQVGGVGTVTALHRLGQRQAFAFSGQFGPGPHTVGVTFLNDRYGGSLAADRNLHVDALAWNGSAMSVGKTQYRTGTAFYPVANASNPSGTTGPGPLQLVLSEDAYQGDAQFSVTVDGRQVGGAQSVTALHRLGQSQTVTFSGDLGAGAHTVGVTFLNDRYGGTAAADRNLYVEAIAWGGTVSSVGRAQFVNGTAFYPIGS